MSSTSEIKICELFTSLEDDWRQLYQAAFPANERESESKLSQLIGAGRLLYHKTTGKNGELLCFSMVSLAPEFSFLAYIATDPNQRSGGIGSKHMKRLLELLKQQYPDSWGLLLEIDATNPKKTTITEEERKVRQRRLGFYRRLGAKKLCSGLDFTGPSRKSGGPDVELDLLFFNFSDEKLDCHTKKRLVAEIYQRFYCLDPDEPLVLEVLRHYGDCKDHDLGCCDGDGDEQPNTGSASADSSTQSGAGNGSTPATQTPPQPAEVPTTPSTDQAPTTPGGDTPVVDPTTGVEIVESDCEVLQKLGKAVDCDCQDESVAGQEPSGTSPTGTTCNVATQQQRSVDSGTTAAKETTSSTGAPVPRTCLRAHGSEAHRADCSPSVSTDTKKDK